MATDWEQIMTGLKARRLDTQFKQVRIHYTADPLKRGDWSQRHSVLYGGVEAPRWRREQEIDYKARGGQRIWPMLSTEHGSITDVSKWTKFRVIDQGIRHPTVCLWVAVNAKGDRHVYKEYYSTDRSIAMNCRAILNLSEGEHISQTFIDPSTRKRGDETLKTLMSVYEENGIYCTPADNSFAGYDTVMSFLLSTLARIAIRKGLIPKFLQDLHPNQDQLLILAQKPALTFDLRFAPRAFEECTNLRWQETKGDMSQRAEIERPMDKEDDGPDCVRYACQSPLFYRREAERTIKIAPFRTMTALLRANKKQKDPISRRAYA